MARLRLPERLAAGRRQRPLPPAPGAREPGPTPRSLLLRSWAGRLFLVSAFIKLLVAILRRLVEPPAIVEIVSAAATLGLLVALVYFLWRLIGLAKQRLLWRVRRKLIISYIFIGVLPAMLIIGFVLLSAGVLSMSVSAYLFKDGYD
ncbi:MAG TPA: hypothetical protein VNT81_00790, partial [Vicinamibacterales bacterium]|nr:hypothetical protein [Vicinamibacterales bacterium]